MFNEDQNVWQAVAEVGVGLGYSAAVYWLKQAQVAKHQWFLTHDLDCAARFADCVDAANRNLQAADNYRKFKVSAAA